MIGNYIYHRVEQKLVNLSVLRKQYLGIEDNNINFEDSNGYFITNNKCSTSSSSSPVERADYREHLTHISWQYYIEQKKDSYSDPLDASLIYILFALISSVSFVGGSALLMFNFDVNKWFGVDSSIILETFKMLQFWGGIILLTILDCCWIFRGDPINSASSRNNLKSNNKKHFSVIFIVYNVIATFIILYFVNEIMMGKDILKFLLLLLSPWVIYLCPILICLEKKDEIEELITPESKKIFRAGIFDEILDDMWQ
ncbi:MAG: hypothetical protein AB4063_09385 [Crocosphaera sp.]